MLVKDLNANIIEAMEYFEEKAKLLKGDELHNFMPPEKLLEQELQKMPSMKEWITDEIKPMVIKALESIAKDDVFDKLGFLDFDSIIVVIVMNTKTWLGSAVLVSKKTEAEITINLINEYIKGI